MSTVYGYVIQEGAAPSKKEKDFVDSLIDKAEDFVQKRYPDHEWGGVFRERMRKADFTTTFRNRRKAYSLLTLIEPGDVLVLPDVQRAFFSLMDCVTILRLFYQLGVTVWLLDCKLVISEKHKAGMRALKMMSRLILRRRLAKQIRQHFLLPKPAPGWMRDENKKLVPDEAWRRFAEQVYRMNKEFTVDQIFQLCKNRQICNPNTQKPPSKAEIKKIIAFQREKLASKNRSYRRLKRKD